MVRSMEKEKLESPLIRWYGFDWGETLMDPRSMPRIMRKLLREIFTELKKPEIADEKISLAFELARKYGEAREVSDFGSAWYIEGTKGRERRLLETIYHFKQLTHRGMAELYLVVLDNDPNAIELFSNREISMARLAKNLRQCLRRLAKKEVSINIVSDSPNETVTRLIFKWLDFWGIKRFFSDIITPAGRFKRNGSVDLRYKGLEKIDGGVYKKIVEDLLAEGILASEAMIVGDRPIDDIKRAKEKGLKTVQFTGVIDRGASEADHVISDLAQLATLLGGPDL